MSQTDKDFVKGNKELKAPDTTEYIDEQEFIRRFEERRKIKKDIEYFARNYFYIISLDKGKCKIDPYPKQEELLKSISSNDRVITLAARQTGKCVDKDSIITVRNKQTGIIERISIDTLYQRIM